jgi:hypothetical protein
VTTLPKIEKPSTATELRNRVLVQLNGEARELSEVDQARLEYLLERMHRYARYGEGW